MAVIVALAMDAPGQAQTVNRVGVPAGDASPTGFGSFKIAPPGGEPARR
jgi:hypothetical protein